MSHEFHSPSQDDLAAIARSRGALMELHQKTQREAAMKRSGLKATDKLCGICGQKIRIKTKNTVQFCGVCQGRLDSGETALVTLDLRWMFVSPDKLLESSLVAGRSVKVSDGSEDQTVTASMIEGLKGKVIGIMPQTMDKLQSKQASNDAYKN
jgi:uncharacterized CHY-type Zn-finger protein